MLIAASLSEKAHLYLWEEPLNYIDVFSRMQLEELLVRQPMTMVFIEHDDAFVRGSDRRSSHGDARKKKKRHAAFLPVCCACQNILYTRPLMNNSRIRNKVNRLRIDDGSGPADADRF
ncbi:MAG: hypothetical protein ACLVJ6_03095 [Merdibacter sp.]